MSGYNFFAELVKDVKKRSEAVAIPVVRVYNNPKARDKGISDMIRQGYEIQSINGRRGDFKAVKGVAMAAIGVFLFGPVGVLAGALAGNKNDEWTIVFVKA